MNHRYCSGGGGDHRYSRRGIHRYSRGRGKWCSKETSIGTRMVTKTAGVYHRYSRRDNKAQKERESQVLYYRGFTVIPPGITGTEE